MNASAILRSTSFAGMDASQGVGRGPSNFANGNVYVTIGVPSRPCCDQVATGT